MSDQTFDAPVWHHGKALRKGYTTGSCATAAAKVAALMVMRQHLIHQVSIVTPSGVTLCLNVESPHVEGQQAVAAIRKDGGDDVDATHGMLIFARVTLNDSGEIVLRGGEGVGTVTRKGVGLPLGSAAINRTPRQKTMGTPGDKRDLQLELMLLADVGMLGMPNAGKSTFIRAVSAAKPKVADYPFTTLVPSLGVVRMDNEKSFVVADIPGLIEGAAEGAGLGIRFLKHLERCRVLLHLIDIEPIDGSDPVENARIIIGELEKYSEKLASKPRWLVFNKIDLMDKAEAEAKAKAIAEALGWEEKFYLISAASQQGVKELCWDVMTFIIENPIVQAEEEQKPEKVEFMWDDYHRQQLEEAEAEAEDDEDWDDDWDEDDEEGVEFIYKR